MILYIKKRELDGGSLWVFEIKKDRSKNDLTYPSDRLFNLV
jgi:hypothetical protein